MPTSLSVVIPAYNEAENLPDLLRRLDGAIGSRKDIEVVLVDNGSTDDSAAVIARLAAVGAYPFLSVCTVPKNQGYGFGILSGLKVAKGDVIGWTHADLQTDPSDVVAAFDRLRARTDYRRVLIKGRRRRRAPFDALFTGAMSIVASVVLHERLTDVNAQPKLFSRDLLPLLSEAPHDFSLDLFVLWRAKREGWSIMTHDVDFATRRFGEANGGGGPSIRGKLRLARRTLAGIFAMRKS